MLQWLLLLLLRMIEELIAWRILVLLVFRFLLQLLRPVIAVAIANRCPISMRRLEEHFAFSFRRVAVSRCFITLLDADAPELRCNRLSIAQALLLLLIAILLGFCRRARWTRLQTVRLALSLSLLRCAGLLVRRLGVRAHRHHQASVRRAICASALLQRLSAEFGCTRSRRGRCCRVERLRERAVPRVAVRVRNAKHADIVAILSRFARCGLLLWERAPLCLLREPVCSIDSGLSLAALRTSSR